MREKCFTYSRPIVAGLSHAIIHTFCTFMLITIHQEYPLFILDIINVTKRLANEIWNLIKYKQCDTL